MSETFAKRLKAERVLKGLTQEQLASRLGISIGTLSGYERNYREPDLSTVTQLAQELRVSVDYLLGNSDNKRHNTIYGLEVNESSSPYNTRAIPIVGNIRAGYPTERIEDIQGYENVDIRLVNGKDAFILAVKGNSMAGDYIFEGDHVVVVVMPEVEPTDIAVVSVRNENATLKRVKRQGETCVLMSSNKDYEPIIVPAKDITIIGKVVETRHRHI